MNEAHVRTLFRQLGLTVSRTAGARGRWEVRGRWRDVLSGAEYELAVTGFRPKCVPPVYWLGDEVVPVHTFADFSALATTITRGGR